MTKKEAIDIVFGNYQSINIKFDRRKKIVKEILQLFPMEELEAIELKKMYRYWNNRKKYTNIVNELKSLERFAASKGSYSKVIIEGNKHLYLASPVYKHADYNKSIFGDNNEHNRKVASIINRWLLKH